MEKTIKARYINGVFQPLTNLQFEEGSEVIITVRDVSMKNEEKSWSNLATSSFAKDWDNDKDAAYDNWKKHYDV